MPPIVACVVVTYNPSPERFACLLDATRVQVASIVVVDNGSSEDNLAWLRGHIDSRLTLVELGYNAGIALAQNAGIARAREGGCHYILLLDHDSIPAPTMVRYLLVAMERLGAVNPRVAAVGPRYLDERQNNPPPFIQVRRMRVIRRPCRSDEDVVEVDYLIASGCLIPVAVFDSVGAMAEHLFIDYVDIEWGLRARAKGFQSYGVCAARMAHDLGEAPIRFMGRSVPLHSPLRHYYHFRNAVWLYLNANLPLQWKVADAWRLLLKYAFYTCFALPRHAHFSMMTRGILDGLRGRLGSYGGSQSSAKSSGGDR